MHRIIFACVLIAFTLAEKEWSSTSGSAGVSKDLAEVDSENAETLLNLLFRNIQKDKVGTFDIPPNSALSAREPEQRFVFTAAIAFGIFGATMRVVNLASGLTQGALSRQTMGEVKAQLQEIENKIDELDMKMNSLITTIVNNQHVTNMLIMYNVDIKRLNFLVSFNNRKISLVDGSYVPADEATKFAEAALSLSSDGLEMVLENYHNMIMGKGSVLDQGSIFAIYMHLQDATSPNFIADVTKFAENVLNLQEAGYALWIQALDIVSKSYTSVQALLTERMAEQADLLAGLTRPWPAGAFGLPKPTTGCPETQGFEWKEGSRYHDCEDTENANFFTHGNHFGYIAGQTNIQQEFCMKYSEGKGAWPKGNYCIFQAEQDCPNGFDCGYIYWDDEDDDNRNNKSGSVPRGEYGRNTLIYYACREDGSWNEEITLPTRKPFYLFRYTSPCQKVKNMRVSEEVVTWDDADGGSESTSSGAHPLNTGTINTELHYCYYE